MPSEAFTRRGSTGGALPRKARKSKRFPNEVRLMLARAGYRLVLHARPDSFVHEVQRLPGSAHVVEQNGIISVGGCFATAGQKFITVNRSRSWGIAMKIMARFVALVLAEGTHAKTCRRALHV